MGRPIGDTQPYYEILRNTKKYQKIPRKSNEKIKSCSAGAKTEDTKSGTSDRRRPEILRNKKKYQKMSRKSNEKIKSCSAGAKTEDTKSGTSDRRHPAILRNIKKYQEIPKNTTKIE